MILQLQCVFWITSGICKIQLQSSEWDRLCCKWGFGSLFMQYFLYLGDQENLIIFQYKNCHIEPEIRVAVHSLELMYLHCVQYPLSRSPPYLCLLASYWVEIWVHCYHTVFSFWFSLEGKPLTGRSPKLLPWSLCCGGAGFKVHPWITPVLPKGYSSCPRTTASGVW